METTITKLIKDGNRVTGAFGYNRQTGEFLLIKAKAVILATGGWGRMYKFTSNSWESTGDGASMAFEAGAKLMDMEMVQFHPTGMIWPPGVRGILVTEGVRGEGGILRNSLGERFMFKDEYMPPHYKGKYAETEREAHDWLTDKNKNRRPPELLPRDEVARSIYKEVLAGRGCTHGGVNLDVTHRGAKYIKAKLPSMYEQFHALASVDITKEPMEVYPTIHYTMGGIWAEPKTAKTSLDGLYAAGESAAGLHGANRLGGNSLTDILVFGKRAGDAAADFAKDAGFGSLDDDQVAEEVSLLMRPLEAANGENPYTIATELQETMQENAFIARTADGLATCLDKVMELQDRAKSLKVPGDKKYNPGWQTARDIQFTLKISEVIVRCAAERKESRGAQWRLDYTGLDEEWGKKNLIAKKDGDKVEISTQPVPTMADHLKKIVEG